MTASHMPGSLKARNPVHSRRGRWTFLLLAAFWFIGAGNSRADEPCALCEQPITGDTIYVVTDKVSNEKREICRKCLLLPDACFVCGLPVRKDYTALEDGRFLCRRDATRAVLDTEEALQLCAEVRLQLGQTLSPTLTFPANVEVKLVDRINLIALFKIPGNDFECPNILGYFQARTNDSRVQYHISILTALQSAELRSTCAHEYGHAWIDANLSTARRKTLESDAAEGFCELVAHTLMDAQNEQSQCEQIEANNYTRGQIALFIEAKQRFGLHRVVEWMKHGADGRLDPANLNALHRLSSSEAASPGTHAAAAAAPGPDSFNAAVAISPSISAPPETLMLKGIFWTGNNPVALINNQSFASGESASVRVGGSNVVIRCLSIGTNSVRIRILASGEEQELALGARTR